MPAHDSLAREFPQILPVNPDHRQSAQHEARRQVAENGNIGEGVLHHDEGHAPKKGAEQQRAMGFEAEAHRMREVRSKEWKSRVENQFFRAQVSWSDRVY